MERTLSIIKPDGVEKNVIGEIYKRFEDSGLTIIETYGTINPMPTTSNTDENINNGIINKSFLLSSPSRYDISFKY